MKGNFLYELYGLKKSTLQKMQDLLYVDDIYNLQKTKKYYDEIMLNIFRLERKGYTCDQKKIKIKQDKDIYTDNSTVSFKHANKHNINPLHLRYVRKNKNPVENQNFLIHRRQVENEIDDELHTKNKTYKKIRKIEKISSKRCGCYDECDCSKNNTYIPDYLNENENETNTSSKTKRTEQFNSGCESINEQGYDEYTDY